MNILIVTPFYKQDKNIASIRWTNIAKRLSTNHRIIIVSQPLDNDMDMTFSIKEEDGIIVARINQKTAYEKVAVRYFGGDTGDAWQTKSSGNTEKLTSPNKEPVQRIIKNCALYEAMKFKAKEYAKEICEKVIPKGMEIDIVISSACPFIEMLFGYELKRKLGCKWISDFRDLPFTFDKNDSTRHMKRIMVRVLKSADAVVTIAPKGREFLVERGIVDKQERIHIITNGYSLDDAQDIETIKDGILHIVHTGSMYGGDRKPDLFFAAIQRAKEIDPDFTYRLECAGGNNEIFITTAQKYSEESNVEDKGFIPRSAALKMQGQADCLLAIVIFRPGSLVAKLFEYMLNKKPVICITSGQRAGSDETLVVNELNLGIAVEEALGKQEIDRLAKYLLDQWGRKKDGLHLKYEPDYEKMNRYDHENIAKKMEDLCITVLNVDV